MLFFNVIFAFWCIVCETYATDGKLLGVHPIEHHLYDSAKDFRCKNGKLTLPFNRVNDDYCDCEDGSDEPSTSACANGVFYCENKDHIGHYISSSRVNDGKCDCCDGSDEHKANSCIDDCLRLAELASEKSVDLLGEDEVASLNLVQSNSKEYLERLEMIKNLDKQRSDMEALTRLLKEQTEEAETAANEALKPFRTPENMFDMSDKEQPIEDEYAHEAFTALDVNDNGILDIDELKREKMFDLNKDGQVDDKEIKWYFDAMPAVANKEVFMKKMWHKMGRLFVLEKELVKSLNFDSESSETTKNEKYTDFNNERIRMMREVAGVREDEVNYNPHAPSMNTKTEDIVWEATKLREELNKAERKLIYIERKKRSIEKSIEDGTNLEEDIIDGEISEHLENFGSKERDKHFPMRMHCFKYTDKLHLYRLCPFHGVTQSRKDDDRITYSLGAWTGWAKDRRGTPVMVFNDGSPCGEGKQRSARARVYCGSKNMLIHVEEPRLCEYIMDFKTPAVCHLKNLKKANVTGTSHDEL